MAHAGGRPLKFKSAEELQVKIDTYFDECDKTGEFYTMSGLAYALETDRALLCRYENKDEFYNTIKNAKRKIESQFEQRALNGQYNPTIAIFLMKNNFNYVDRQEQEVVVKEKSKAERLSESLFNED